MQPSALFAKKGALIITVSLVLLSMACMIAAGVIYIYSRPKSTTEPTTAPKPEPVIENKAVVEDPNRKPESPSQPDPALQLPQNPPAITIDPPGDDSLKSHEDEVGHFMLLAGMSSNHEDL